MDNTTTFRIILVVVGVAILAAIVLFGNPDKSRKPRASRKRKQAAAKRKQQQTRREPTLGAIEDTEDTGATPEVGSEQPELAMEPQTESEEKPPEPKRSGPPPDKVVALFLQARDNHTISGVDLLDAALKSGMIFGDQNIFHRLQDEDDRPVFSMANLTKPGYFDKTSWNTLETRGVTMFMALPGPLSALDAWDAMLATSRRISQLLHCDLLDDSQSTFTRQREGQIREDLRDYERHKAPEA